MYTPQYRYRNERQRMEIAALGVRRWGLVDTLSLQKTDTY